MIGSLSTTAPPERPTTTKVRLNVTRLTGEYSWSIQRDDASSSIDCMQRVKVGTLARARRPLIRAFNSRAFTPLVERCDELPMSTRRHHTADIPGPSIHVS